MERRRLCGKLPARSISVTVSLPCRRPSGRAGQTIVRSEQAIASIGKQMKNAESRFRLAAGVKDFDKSAAGLTAKLTLLSSVLGKSPSVWFAVAAAVIAGTIALADYVSGAKEAREALKNAGDRRQMERNRC